MPVMKIIIIAFKHLKTFLACLTPIAVLAFANTGCGSCTDGGIGYPAITIGGVVGGEDYFVATNPVFNNITRIDPASMKISNVDAGPSPASVVLMQDGAVAMVVGSDGSVRRIELSSGTVTRHEALDGFTNFFDSANPDLIFATNFNYTAVYNLQSGHFAQYVGTEYKGSFRDDTRSLLMSTSSFYLLDNQTGEQICSYISMISPKMGGNRLVYYHDQLGAFIMIDLDNDAVGSDCIGSTTLPAEEVASELKINEDLSRMAFVSRAEGMPDLFRFYDFSDTGADFELELNLNYPPKATASTFRMAKWKVDDELNRFVMCDRFGEGAFIIDPILGDSYGFMLGRLPMFKPATTVVNANIREVTIDQYYTTRMSAYQPYLHLHEQTGMAFFADMIMPDPVSGFQDGFHDQQFSLRLYDTDSESASAEELLYPDYNTAHSISYYILGTTPPSEKLILFPSDEPNVSSYFSIDGIYLKGVSPAQMDLPVMSLEIFDTETFSRQVLTFREDFTGADGVFYNVNDGRYYIYNLEERSFNRFLSTDGYRLDGDDGELGLWLFSSAAGINVDSLNAGGGLSETDFCGAPSNIGLLNISTNQYFNFGCAPTGIFIDPSESFTMIPDRILNRIYVIENNTGNLTIIRTEANPESVAFTKDGNWALVNHSHPLGRYTVFSLPGFAARDILAPGAEGLME
jgi:hypothetical protein